MTFELDQTVDEPIKIVRYRKYTGPELGWLLHHVTQTHDVWIKPDGELVVVESGEMPVVYYMSSLKTKYLSCITTYI